MDAAALRLAASTAMAGLNREVAQPAFQFVAKPDGPPADVAGRRATLAEERRADAAVPRGRLGGEGSRQLPLVLGITLRCHAVGLDGSGKQVEPLRLGAQHVDDGGGAGMSGCSHPPRVIVDRVGKLPSFGGKRVGKLLTREKGVDVLFRCIPEAHREEGVA